MKHLFLPMVFLWLSASLGAAQSAPASPGQPFVVEYYYKTKWGHAEEFLKLFKKNHYPLLKKEVEMGRLLKVGMDQPRYHTTEDGRWDYRVTIIFKNATVANEPFDEDALKKQLFPDQETYTREEQRRFEILDAHWDLPIRLWTWKSEAREGKDEEISWSLAPAPAARNQDRTAGFGCRGSGGSVRRAMKECYCPTNMLESRCRRVANAPTIREHTCSLESQPCHKDVATRWRLSTST